MAGNGGDEGRREKRQIAEEEKPLVSVVIPAYNCSRTLAQAIDSALAQEISMEILVLDNGSVEDLSGVMEQYRGNPVVHYRRNEENLGASGSRNMGVEMARGSYVAFLDSDDWWEKGKLKKQLDRIEQTGDVLCATARELVTPEGRRTGRVIPVPETSPTGRCWLETVLTVPPYCCGQKLPGNFLCAMRTVMRIILCG